MRTEKEINILIPLIWLTAMAACVSFFRLTANNLWWDEVINLILARQEYSKISLSSIFIVPHAPLYFQLLHIVTRIIGTGEFLLRLPSAVFGTLSVSVFFLFTQKALGRKTAVIGAFLFCLSPLRLWYSQEATPHIMGLCLTLTANFMFYLFASNPNKRHLSLWVIFNVLSFYTTNHSLLIIATQAVFLILQKNDSQPVLSKKYIGGLIVQLILYCPQIFNLVNSLNLLRTGFWLPPITLSALKYSTGNFFLGYTATSAEYNLVSVLAAAAFIIVITRSKYAKARHLFLAFGLAPMLFVFATHFVIGTYIDRHNMIFMPPFFMAAAAVLAAIRPKALRIVITASIAALITLSAFNYYTNTLPIPAPDHGHTGIYIKKNISEVVDYIEKNSLETDMWATTTIGLTGLIQYYSKDNHPLYYFYSMHYDRYWQQRLEFYRPCPHGTPPFYVKSRWSTIVFMDTNRNKQAALKSFPERIWLIQSDWTRSGNMDENSSACAKLLKKEYTETTHKWMHGVLISLYIKTPDKISIQSFNAKPTKGQNK